MLLKTKGIVFHSLKYSETSIITKIYTESLGLQSYIINGVRSAGRRNRASLFQPLNILDLEVYKKENKQLNRLREFKIAHVFRSIPFNVFKSSIALFVMEILNSVIKEEESDENLFRFIEKSLIGFDESQNYDPNYHLHFLIDLTKYLGFLPDGFFSTEHPFLDLKEGAFTNARPLHAYFLNASLSGLVSRMLKGHNNIQLTSNERADILVGLLQYYKLHITDFKAIKSHQVLHEVFEA